MLSQLAMVHVDKLVGQTQSYSRWELCAGDSVCWQSTPAVHVQNGHMHPCQTRCKHTHQHCRHSAAWRRLRLQPAASSQYSDSFTQGVACAVCDLKRREWQQTAAFVRHDRQDAVAPLTVRLGAACPYLASVEICKGRTATIAGIDCRINLDAQQFVAGVRIARHGDTRDNALGYAERVPSQWIASHQDGVLGHTILQ